MSSDPERLNEPCVISMLPLRVQFLHEMVTPCGLQVVVNFPALYNRKFLFHLQNLVRSWELRRKDVLVNKAFVDFFDHRGRLRCCSRRNRRKRDGRRWPRPCYLSGRCGTCVLLSLPKCLFTLLYPRPMSARKGYLRRVECLTPCATGLLHMNYSIGSIKIDIMHPGIFVKIGFRK